VLAVPFTLDLNYISQAIGNRTFQPIAALMVAAIWYLAITSVLMVGQYYVERYYGRGFDQHGAAGRRGRQAAINAARTTPDGTTFDDMGRPSGGAA
jgi:polar amino acid transport system permease protein